MNARQKAKKLKKELAELKADRTNGFTWLKIDGIRQKETPSCLWYDNIPIFRIPITYEVQIGHMRAEFTPESPEDSLITIDSKKLDEAIKNRMEGAGNDNNAVE